MSEIEKPPIEDDPYKYEKRGQIRYGSPTFYRLLQEMADIHSRKSHDYARQSNPFGNYEFAGYVASLFAHSPHDAGFAGRLAEKMFRLAVLESQDKTPMNEGIEDTERDIAVIATLWMASRRDKKIRTSQQSQTKNDEVPQKDPLIRP